MRPVPEPLFHIAERADWASARDAYLPSGFGDDGFVHCSTQAQVLRIANERFAGRSDLILLLIDPSRVEAEIRFENLRGGTELFPHIYGPVECSAVIAVEQLVPGGDGRFNVQSIEETLASEARATRPVA
jgi:uncharacterized protein (DUF952 family)